VVVEVEEEEVDDDIGAARDREIGGLVFLSRKIRTQRSLFLFEKKKSALVMDQEGSLGIRIKQIGRRPMRGFYRGRRLDDFVLFFRSRRRNAWSRSKGRNNGRKAEPLPVFLATNPLERKKH
jgi:hypothetical protein